MSLTYLAAKDEMFTMFATAWATVAPAILPTVPYVYYPGVERPQVPPSDEYFALLDLIVLEERQKTLAIDVVSLGQRMYNNLGLLQLQIACPLSDSQNSDIGARLSIVARDAFRGKHSPCGVVFYNAMFTQSLSTEVFSKFIMTVEYNYTDIY